MAAAKTFTWDFDLLLAIFARAASLGDLGDAALVDDAADPPIPPEMPYADELNQWALQLGGINRIIPGVDIEIGFTAGTPSIVNVMAMSSIITTTWAQANMTVVDNGAGDTSITWAPGVLPPPRGKPGVRIVVDGSFLAPTVVPVANGVRVKTRDNTNTLVDTNFAVTVF